MDSKIIDQYEQGGTKLKQAIAGLSRQDMLWKPSDPTLGKWSIHQIVIHLRDSEMVSRDRMQRIIAENNPLLIGYNENDFVQNLFYEEQSIDEAVAQVDLNRRNFAQVLRKLAPETWKRSGVHNERGRIVLENYLASTVEHLDHHLSFVGKKRAKLGKAI